MTLKFVLPEADPSLALSVETDPKKVKDWLIALPTANVLEAGRLIQGALAVLNRVKVDADVRTTLLTEYQNSLEMLTGAFEIAYASPGLPMKESARAAAQLARNVWLELAVGWKLAIADKLEKRFGFFNAHPKAPPQLMQALLYAYWRVYQVSGRLYQTLPEGIWSECHQLFRYAAENKMLDEPKNENAKEKSARPIATLYKQMVLLALADPHRFAGLELDKVLEIIESYAPHAHFQPLSKLASSAGFFLVELNTDKAPCYVGNRSLDNYAGQAVLFDTIELAKKLHKAEHTVEAKAPMAKDRVKVQMWLEILRRVIRQWSIVPHRHYQRIPTESTVSVAFGIRRAVFRLNAGQHLVNGHDKPIIAEKDLQLTQWQVINESPGGYGILAHELPKEQAKAGEIVALSVAENANWMVASIRWLHQHHNGSMEMGLQVMSAKAVPVLMRPTLGAETPAYFPALMLPAIPALKQAARIVTQKGQYTPLREYSVIMGQREQFIRTAKLVEQQNGYDLFEFTGELTQ
ncbi:hypothetical protein HQ393_05830 [Chitinibacter bivalviorum]|uniref:PH domain-containing protein n=1 Tax=Chitinibacter bivalviorum TaxID=2739434 RepID=A0A7H9BHR5_9NEIS|nr:hypothetical protein [Chitinibacter bivalviorum]QLG87816.1 hypothetical protein HQ393_05830 [Chitinibacter bivalviorum]